MSTQASRPGAQRNPKKISPEAKRRMEQRRRQMRRKKLAKRRARQRKIIKMLYARRYIFGAGILAAVFLIIFVAGLKGCPWGKDAGEKQAVSEAVIAYKPLIEKYAKEYDIEDQTELLMAIMQVESRGEGNDVMQSSESLGLAINSLMPEESIRQGCHVFSQLLSYGKNLGCDINSVIQAYNFGITYLDYVAENGKKHSFDLAQLFSEKMSGGVTVDYVNPLSVQKNGGWRYNYGNMFYVDLVRQYY